MIYLNVASLRRAAERADAGPNVVVSRALLADIVDALTGARPAVLVNGPAEPPPEAIRQAKILNAVDGMTRLRP